VQLVFVNTIAMEWIERISALNRDAMNWFELGQEIVRGEVGRWTERRETWRWDQPNAVEASMVRLNADQSSLFPMTESNAGWLEELPACFRAWGRIETGLHSLPTAPLKLPALNDSEINQPARVQRRERILQILRDRERRLMATEICRAIEQRFHEPESEPKVRQDCRVLVQRGLLDNDPKARPRGYGLCEWKTRGA